MLYALGDPLSFVVLAVSFVVAVTASGWVSCLAAARGGDAQLRAEGRLRPDPRRHLDPFGTVAGLIAGFGWARPLPPVSWGRRSPGNGWAAGLAGAATNLVLAAAALLAYRGVSGVGLAVTTAGVLQHGAAVGGMERRGLLLFGLMNAYVGALSLVPLPPLNGGRLLFSRAPRTTGWQKASYYLVDQNFGLVAVLVLLLLPLGGQQALLPRLLDTALSPLVRLLTGG